MSTYIVRDFKWSRDYRKIDWKSTLIYNHVRAFGAGIIAGLIMILSGDMSSYAIIAPILWPAMYLLIIVPVSIILNMLIAIPFVGLFLFVMGIWTVGLGDPIALILRKFFPWLVPVEDPPILSPIPIIFVLKADDEIILARED